MHENWNSKGKQTKRVRKDERFTSKDIEKSGAKVSCAGGCPQKVMTTGFRVAKCTKASQTPEQCEAEHGPYDTSWWYRWGISGVIVIEKSLVILLLLDFHIISIIFRGIPVLTAGAIFLTWLNRLQKLFAVQWCHSGEYLVPTLDIFRFDQGEEREREREWKRGGNLNKNILQWRSNQRKKTIWRSNVRFCVIRVRKLSCRMACQKLPDKVSVFWKS